MYLKSNTFILRGSVFVKRNCMMPLVTIKQLIIIQILHSL